MVSLEEEPFSEAGQSGFQRYRGMSGFRPNPFHRDEMRTFLRFRRLNRDFLPEAGLMLRKVEAFQNKSFLPVKTAQF